MANSARGSVSLQAGDKAYTLSFSVNALCEIEDVFDMPVQKIGDLFSDEDNISMRNVRKIVWVALHDHHPDISEKEAGLIATEAGITECMSSIGRAFSLAFPEAKAGANPRKAKASSR